MGEIRKAGQNHRFYNAFLTFSKQQWMLLTVKDFNKTKYDTNQKTRTTVICFKFQADKKFASVTLLQSEGYLNNLQT